MKPAEFERCREGGKMEIRDFFEQKISACELARKRLQEEGYGDEADFEKIKANVYEIFNTVWSAAIKQYGADQPGAWDFLKEKLEQIPSSWAVAYEKAKQHDDVKAMHIESIKLSVAEDIKQNMVKTEEEPK